MIYCRFPVSMVRAALGARLEIPTIYGKKHLDIPAGSQSGDLFTLAGEGVANLRGRGKGDKYHHQIHSHKARVNFYGTNFYQELR